jgi:hypothetical protein
VRAVPTRAASSEFSPTRGHGAELFGLQELVR